jgi:hypothetical protein
LSNIRLRQAWIASTALGVTRRGNVQLVCIAVNFGLGQWGEEVFRTIAEATVRNQPPPKAMRETELDERISAWGCRLGVICRKLALE